MNFITFQGMAPVAAAVCLVAGLTACGGGGGGDDSANANVTPTVNSTAIAVSSLQGFWAPSTRDKSVVITSDGEYWGMLSNGTLEYGHATVSGNTVVVPVAQYSLITTAKAGTGTLVGTYESPSKFSLTNFSGTSTPYTFEADYNLSATLSSLVGTWRYTVGTATMTTVVQANGTFTYSDYRGCAVDGRFTPDPDGYFYRVTGNFRTSATCPISGVAMKGIGLMSDNQLAVLSLTTDEKSAFLIAGSK